MQQLEALRRNLDVDVGSTCEIAAGPAQAVDEPGPLGIAADRKYNRYRPGRRLQRQRRRRGGGNNQIYLAANQIGRQCRQPVILFVSPDIFDSDVLAVDIAGLAQRLAKHRQHRPVIAGGSAAQYADDRQRRLRMRGDWPETEDAAVPPSSAMNSRRFIIRRFPPARRTTGSCFQKLAHRRKRAGGNQRIISRTGSVAGSIAPPPLRRRMVQTASAVISAPPITSGIQ